MENLIPYDRAIKILDRAISWYSRELIKEGADISVVCVEFFTEDFYNKTGCLTWYNLENKRRQKNG